MYNKVKVHKTIKSIALISIVMTLSACELLKGKAIEAPAQTSMQLCVTPEHKALFMQFCDTQTWFDYILTTQTLTWPQRTKMIQELGEDHVSTIYKILLSQGPDTPYKQRLRSQNWIVKLSNDASETMKLVLDDTIYANSQQLLEFESAITILSRVNARQEKEIQALRLQLQNRESEIIKQQQQVEQLLKIEADLSKQNRNDGQRSNNQLPINTTQNDGSK